MKRTSVNVLLCLWYNSIWSLVVVRASCSACTAKNHADTTEKHEDDPWAEENEDNPVMRKRRMSRPPRRMTTHLPRMRRKVSPVPKRMRRMSYIEENDELRRRMSCTKEEEVDMLRQGGGGGNVGLSTGRTMSPAMMRRMEDEPAGVKEDVEPQV